MSLPRHHRPAAAVGAGLIAVLALGACSGSGSTGSSAGAGVSAVAPANPDLGGAPDAAPDAAADAQKLAESSGQGAAAGSPGSGTAARNASPSSAADVAAADKLVRTASLQVQVDDVEAKAAEARQVALAAGGTVVSENSSAVPVSSGGVDKQGSRSTMSLSVPADTLDRVLDDLGKLGTTVQRSSSARDVTSTYVDTQSRITTMKAGLDQVRTLLGKTTDLNQIISLETEIARRQGDLDSLQAQLNSLDKKVAMSTVSVTLVTAANVVVPEEDTSGFLGGLQKGWKAFLGASSGLLTVLGAVLPFVVLLAIVAVPLLWWRRRRTAARPAEGGYATSPPPAAGSRGPDGGSGPHGGPDGSGGPGGADPGADPGSGPESGARDGRAAKSATASTQSGSPEGYEASTGGSGAGVREGDTAKREPEIAGAGAR
ncbi:MAG TPA: DUF4349 domain-containing protein [Lapillicoccus sp.]|uniref:DUF4349 domain-containing protein n=1 Tax=Lapillicoccus sp. TaxID=1909287 RepID=UPI002F92FABA